jgi:hypothetical protein
MVEVAAFLLHFERFHHQILFDAHGAQILDLQIGSYGVRLTEAVDLAHRFVQHQGDDPAVNPSARALIFRGYLKMAANTLVFFVQLKDQTHSTRIRAAATETRIRRIGFEAHLDQGHPGRLFPPRAAPALAQFGLQQTRQNAYAAGNLFFIERGKSEAHGVQRGILGVKMAAGHE